MDALRDFAVKISLPGRSSHRWHPVSAGRPGEPKAPLHGVSIGEDGPVPVILCDILSCCRKVGGYIDRQIASSSLGCVCLAGPSLPIPSSLGLAIRLFFEGVTRIAL